MGRSRGIPILLVALGLMGCARGRDLPPMMGKRKDEPVKLTVQNQRFEDAAIYATWRGKSERRIGLAIGTQSTTFTFPWVADEVQFRVDFIALDGYSVDPIDVSPGDHLDLVILNGSGG